MQCNTANIDLIQSLNFICNAIPRILIQCNPQIYMQSEKYVQSSWDERGHIEPE